MQMEGKGWKTGWMNKGMYGADRREEEDGWKSGGIRGREVNHSHAGSSVRLYLGRVVLEAKC